MPVTTEMRMCLSKSSAGAICSSTPSTSCGSTETMTTSDAFTAEMLSFDTSNPCALKSSSRWTRRLVRVILAGAKCPDCTSPFAMLVPMFPAPRMAILNSSVISANLP